MTRYERWLKELDDFKAATKDVTFELNGLKIEPGEASDRSVIIRRPSSGQKERINLTELEAQFVVNGLNKIYGVL